MKHVHLVSLLQENFTTVNVLFGGKDERTWAYKVPLAWDVLPGDKLVVPVKRGDYPTYAVASVLTVDEAPVINVDADYGLRWAVQKLDFTEFFKLIEKEARALRVLQDLERRQMKEALVKEFSTSVLSLPGGEETLAKLVNDLSCGS